MLARGRGAAARPREITLWMPGVTVRPFTVPPPAIMGPASGDAGVVPGREPAVPGAEPAVPAGSATGWGAVAGGRVAGRARRRHGLLSAVV